MEKQRVVLITGAASGIGLQIAKQFIGAGEKVIACDINESSLQTLAGELGDSYQPTRLDVGDDDAISALVEEVNESFGRLDALINNAATAALIEPEQLTAEHFDSEIGINLRGPMLLVKYFAPLLRKSDNGSVVNISSMAAITETPAHFLYSTAKVAIKKFTEDCARGVTGIRHNTVLPGIIETPILDGYGDQADTVRSYIKETTPAGRVGTPEDIANAVEFLCSDKATYINGAALIVDGGLTKATSSPIQGIMG